MKTSFVKSVIAPGKENNYLIGGNVTNAFAIGEIGATDDFYLVGMEPEAESNEPALTGTILDSSGKVLFRIENNFITVNPGRCSQIIGTGMGYKIRDFEGKEIMKVSTRLEEINGVEGETYVTTISGDFFNKKGELVFKARSGGQEESIESNVKMMMGITNSGSSLSVGFTTKEDQYVLSVIGMKKVLKIIEGTVENKSLELNGCALFDAQIINCNVTISGGKFALFGRSNFNNCKIEFVGEALAVARLATKSGHKF